MSYKVFLHEPNDTITVIDGNKSISMRLGAFMELEPDYSLPEGYIARTYERRGSTGYHVLRLDDSSTESQPIEWAEGDTYIANIQTYIDAFTFERPNDLASVKNRRKQEINAMRDGYISRGVTYTASNGTEVPVDVRDIGDRANISGLVQEALYKQQIGDTTLTQFRGSDNKTYALTVADTIEMGLEVMAWVKQHYAIAWFHKDNIDALTITEDVENYDITTQWP